MPKYWNVWIKDQTARFVSDFYLQYMQSGLYLDYPQKVLESGLAANNFTRRQNFSLDKIEGICRRQFRCTSNGAFCSLFFK